jgi:RHS repeat-associated protein
MMIRSTDDLLDDDQTTDADRYAFDGHDFDPEVGVQYERLRHFDPQTGRWLTVEPVGYEADVNLYRYVGNAPMNSTDPSAE